MKIFDQLEKYAAYALLALMAVIVLSATLEVGYEIATNLFEPPGFFIGVRDLFELFGLFLMVLIGIGFIVLSLTGGYFFMRRGKSDS
jgi:hypothetical protein